MKTKLYPFFDFCVQALPERLAQPLHSKIKEPLLLVPLTEPIMYTRTARFFGIALLAALFLMPALSMAQRFQRLSPEDQLTQQLDRMTERLNLTDEQVAQVTPILEEAIAQRQAKRKELQAKGFGPETRQAMRAEMDKLRAAQDEKLKAILTEEQMAEHAKMQEEQRNRRPRRSRRN